MKVNQIVSEHKKGVRAMKYATKTKGTVPVYGPDSKDAKLKPVKPTGTLGEEVAPGTALGKIEKVDPTTKQATIKTTSGEEITQPLDTTAKVDDNTVAMAAPADNPQDLVGDNVVAKETGDEPVGGDATDSWVSEIDKPLYDEVGDKPYYVDMSSGKPMVKSGNGLTPVQPSKMWTQISPEVIAKATAQGFRQINISVNGQILQGFEGGGKIIVSPTDFAAMSSVKEVQSPFPSRNPGTPAADAAAQAAAQPPQQHQSVMPSRNNESLDRIRFLSGL
jgi:hypothetical protein